MHNRITIGELAERALRALICFLIGALMFVIAGSPGTIELGESSQFQMMGVISFIIGLFILFWRR